MLCYSSLTGIPWSAGYPIQNPLRWLIPSTFLQEGQKYMYLFPNLDATLRNHTVCSSSEQCGQMGTKSDFSTAAISDMATPLMGYRYRWTTATTSGKSIPSRFNVSGVGMPSLVQPRRS